MGNEIQEDTGAEIKMTKTDFEFLARWSVSVRDSTIKRLKQVKPGHENQHLTADSMSFADLAQHLIDSDLRILAALASKTMGKNMGRAGMAKANSRAEYESLINRLEKLKHERSEMIASLTEETANQIIVLERIAGTEHVPYIEVIIRMLEHEAHHRGQISAYLEVVESTK